MELVQAMGDADRKRIREALRGNVLGHEEVDDPRYRAFFEQKVVKDPKWAPALATVVGGMTLIRRYERIVGLPTGGS